MFLVGLGCLESRLTPALGIGLGLLSLHALGYFLLDFYLEFQVFFRITKKKKKTTVSVAKDVVNSISSQCGKSHFLLNS